jgi:hypothetical protein
MVHPPLPEAQILPNSAGAERTTGLTGLTARTGTTAGPARLRTGASAAGTYDRP